jgi:hypothetical protein
LFRISRRKHQDGYIFATFSDFFAHGYTIDIWKSDIEYDEIIRIRRKLIVHSSTRKNLNRFDILESKKCFYVI